MWIFELEILKPTNPNSNQFFLLKTQTFWHQKKPSTTFQVIVGITTEKTIKNKKNKNNDENDFIPVSDICQYEKKIYIYIKF